MLAFRSLKPGVRSSKSAWSNFYFENREGYAEKLYLQTQKQQNQKYQNIWLAKYLIAE